MQTQIQNIMLSKDTISNLNKILHSTPQIQPLIKDNTNEVLNILIKNMKIIYKKIDLSKINNNNFNSLFEQYKKHCIQHSLNEINETLIPHASANIKFKRDFNSNPNSGNQLMDRPTSTKIDNNFNQDYSSNNNIQSIDMVPGASINNEPISSLDNVFQPLINPNDNNLFNIGIPASVC